MARYEYVDDRPRHVDGQIYIGQSGISNVYKQTSMDRSSVCLFGRTRARGAFSPLLLQPLRCSLESSVTTLPTLPKPWACVSRNVMSTSIEAVEGVGVTEAVVHW